jgi:DNA-binding Xre family transcriptional regulator
MPTPKNVMMNPDGSKTVKITKLRRLQIESGMTNTAFAAKCGIHTFAFSKYANGDKDITVKHLRFICQALNLQPEQVLGWETYTIP